MIIFLARAMRKTSFMGRLAAQKITNLFQKIENKANRIVNGTDSSFTPKAKIPMEKIYYGGLPYIAPLHPALPSRGRKATVTLLIPTVDKNSFFGGTATAIIAAALLAEKTKRDLRIIQTIKKGYAPIKEFLERENINFGGTITLSDVSGRSYNVYGYVDIHDDDIFMASAWWDAYLLQRLPLNKKFIYIIQDFEPIFYNNSDLYVLAESTYHQDNFISLCNTKLMYDFMLNRNYDLIKSGTWFEPAVATKLASSDLQEQKTKRRLFLYGRPNVERNLYYTGIKSIDDCFAAKYLDPNEWELFMGGFDGLNNIELTSGISIKNLGKMKLEDYREFVSTVDVAVSLMMAPHPNYPTLEFASSGAAVVTTRYDIKQDLSNYSKNIIMADISPESISGAINKAASLSIKERISNSSASNIPTSWVEAMEEPLDNILTKLGISI